jgi:hypothetical protein
MGSHASFGVSDAIRCSNFIICLYLFTKNVTTFSLNKLPETAEPTFPTCIWQVTDSDNDQDIGYLYIGFS